MQLEGLISEVVRETPGARLGLCCPDPSPPGTPADWYADVVARVAGDGLSIALDTSGEPLREAVRRESHRIDVIKPNEEELADLVGVDPASLTSVDRPSSQLRRHWSTPESAPSWSPWAQPVPSW